MRHNRQQPTFVNLNTDPLEEIARVPGIDRDLAEALIAYREQNGPLRNWGELRNVPGFEDETLREAIQREAHIE